MTHSDQAVSAEVDLAAASQGLAGLQLPPMDGPGPGGDRRRAGLAVGLAGLVLASGVGWSCWAWLVPAFFRPDDRLQRLPKSTVAKVDMSTQLTAWGRVESSHNTIISCELERLEVRNAGRSVSSGGASTILTLIEEGKQVKAGEVLCTLDSSEYEELVRTQEIKTEQAGAAMEQARLNFEVAELAVREFRDGLYHQQIQSLEGLIALAQSDVERAVDRLLWTDKMLDKGYASLATKSGAKRMLSQCQHDLMTSRLELTNFLEYGKNRTLMELASEVEKRRFEVIANTQRVTRNRDQLAHYRSMVEKCTIRAPHDGFLIYATDPYRPQAAAIEPGQTVRQSQKLFYLPDLGNMEVLAYIHESVATRVLEGMRARARIEGLANRALEGHVVSVAPLPTNAGNWFSDEVKYFVGLVRLDSPPVGLRPGMTAEVEFDVDRRLDVLAVPTEAVAVEGGHDFCYVAKTDGLERRPVTLGRSSRDLLEVTKGLTEGDQVVLNPDKVDSLSSLVVQRSEDSAAEDRSVAESVPAGPTTAVE